MRRGPSPLPLHLAMAASQKEDIHPYASSALNEDDAIEMVRGIKMYQEHSYVPQAMPSLKIWESGCCTIFAPHEYSYDEGARVLLLVPSLINKSNILDLHPKQSMLRWFAEQGVHAYLLDWGTPAQSDDAEITMDELITSKLCEAIRHISTLYSQKIHVLGYCMGGTFCLGAYPFVSDHVRSLSLLSSPWDFHAQDYELARSVRISSHGARAQIDAHGALPAYIIQGLFAGVDPRHVAQKFKKFAHMDPASFEAELFICVEDWLNDGVDVPHNVASYCIQKWFMDNVTQHNDWCIQGTKIIPSLFDASLLLVTPEHDKIVPPNSAYAAPEKRGSSRPMVITPSCGHVGLVAGRHAVRDVWQPVYDWIQRQAA